MLSLLNEVKPRSPPPPSPRSLLALQPADNETLATSSDGILRAPTTRAYLTDSGNQARLGAALCSPRRIVRMAWIWH